jgi:hypothetical protein
MFQLTKEEFKNLRFQFGISSLGYGGRRYLPYVFTEQGVAMLSSVLKSKRAIAVNIAIMRAFVKLREVMSTHKDLARKIEELEEKQKKQGLDIAVIFKVIKKLINPPEKLKENLAIEYKCKNSHFGSFCFEKKKLPRQRLWRRHAYGSKICFFTFRGLGGPETFRNLFRLFRLSDETRHDCV